ncbi:hypothetical protein BDW22DRAFT_1347090 [Trametopsis cervina]|nr:hypothetical protein BDW22DRAFT_1347090 [Trametopsis cervina]
MPSAVPISDASATAIHRASLVDASLHSPELLEMTHLKMSRVLIEYAVDCVIDTVDYAMGKPSSSSSSPSSSSSSSTRGRRATRPTPLHAAFQTFATSVLTKAEVTVPVLLVALAYMDRARPHLQIALEQWACERVFLGALILANKYTNDSTLKNVHWALCTGVFGKRDIGRIEREFLDVLDYELAVTDADILSHYPALMAAVEPPASPRARNHVRSHHRVHVELPQHTQEPEHVRVHHHHKRHASTEEELEGSRWSDDESESEDEEDRMPVTPALPHESTTDIAVAKHEEQSHPHHHPEPVESKPAPLVHHHQQQQQHHHRLSNALHLLKSFPIPHFHHSHHHHRSSSGSSSEEVSPVSSCASSSGSSVSGSIPMPMPVAIAA